MNTSPDPAELRRLQEASLGVLARGVERLAEGREAMLAANAGLREEMNDVLFSYQRFKHERIFDPAITSGDPERAAWARHMKVICISAGEVFRTHMIKWNHDRIAADWDGYRVASRLTANQLRRHMMTEAEGIAELLAAYS